MARIRAEWGTGSLLREAGFRPDLARLATVIETFKGRTDRAADVGMLLTAEAEMTKGLYNLAVDAVGYGDFTRAKRGEGTDVANRFLDHGNYLAYGMGATATWVLGLPHALAVLHGKTRRGALVFDAADLVKDAVILPLAFVAAMRGDQDQQFRVACLDALARTEALDFIIECLKAVAVGELVATCERAYKLRQISHPIAPVRSPRSGARYHVTTRRHHLTSEARSP